MPPESKPPPVAIGEVLAGKYRVERVIGEGGMGIVVAATHLQLQTVVALKFILEDRGQAVERFLREARSAVRLKSEHVARVSDVGTLENGMPYMVMEYLEGRDLHSVLVASGPLPVSDAVGYVIHASEAVAEAHSLGIVHRDLKPHNLFLTSGVGGRPKVKVLDFGISKSAGVELALTKSMEIVGTPNYMSPEQLRSSKDVDLRTDVWAIGAVMYELLTGRVPFEADTLPQLCTMVLSERPSPPNTHRPDIPQGVADAIMRCLQRAPEDRFADVGELVTALAPFAPEWAPARAVLDVPRSSTSGAGRAVISSPSGGSSKTDAAWSETELARPARARWKVPAIALGACAALVVAFNMGAVHDRLRTSPRVAGTSAAASAGAPVEPVNPPPAAPTSAPATSTPLPSASVPAAGSSASSAGPAVRAAAPPTPRKPLPKPASATPPDDQMGYR
jgi:eukaryotic-like serine/threonine-protein kinase